MTNAIVHGYGGGEGTVRLHATLFEDDLLRVDVIDAGRGIENVEMARTPFLPPAKMTNAPAWALPSWRASWTRCR